MWYYIFEWFEYELSFGDSGVWDGEFGCVYYVVFVEQDVDVDCAVAVSVVWVSCSAEFIFYCLGLFQELVWCECGLYDECLVEIGVGAFVSMCFALING